MAASATDYFMKTGKSTATTLSAPGYTIGNTSINVGTTAELPTDTGIFIMIDEVETVGGVEQRVAGTYNVFRGTVATGTSINNLVYVGGDANRNYSAGATTRVYMTVSSYHTNRLIDGLLTSIDQDGTLKAGAVDNTAVLADSIVTRAKLATALTSEINTDWKAGLLPAVSSVTENGNRSADITFASTVASILTPGMRIRTSRTVAAPTGAILLNGTTQYASKTTPSNITFTDDFVVSAWVKLTSYVDETVVSRWNGTSGWNLNISSTGTINLAGFNAGAGNTSGITSYQSVPLGKWVHIAAQLDMSAFTATPTTSYIMIDGVDVPATVTRGGTNPTALVQAGNLEIGSRNGGTLLFAGNIGQVAVFSAKVTQATIRTYKNQTLSGSETSLNFAAKLDQASGLNDLTANANNLTATGSPTYSTASPFTTDANGTPGGTYDYAIVTKVATTVATVQYPEGNAIPTSGGISAVDYSGVKAPFGMPVDSRRWRVESLYRVLFSQSSPVTSTWYNLTSTSGTSGGSVHVEPIGEWRRGYEAIIYSLRGVSGTISHHTTLSTANNTAGDSRMIARSYASTILDGMHVHKKESPYQSTTASTLYLNVMTDASSVSSIQLFGNTGDTIIYSDLAYL